MYSMRIEYAYDADNNCTDKATYSYIEEDWVLEYTMFYTYDHAVPVENTAGIFMVWEDELPIYNKVLNWQVQYDDVAESTVLYYSGCVGLAENAENPLTLWPNPAHETLSLNAGGLRQVEIFSMDGRQVMRIENGLETLNVSDLAQGCYLLKATFTDGSKVVRKFVKE